MSSILLQKQGEGREAMEGQKGHGNLGEANWELGDARDGQRRSGGIMGEQGKPGDARQREAMVYDIIFIIFNPHFVTLPPSHLYASGQTMSTILNGLLPPPAFFYEFRQRFAWIYMILYGSILPHPP